MHVLRERLFKYAKANGASKGKLVKCFKERVVKDFTLGTAPNCHRCGTQFARDGVVRGRPAWIIIGGKVRMK